MNTGSLIPGRRSSSSSSLIAWQCLVGFQHLPGLYLPLTLLLPLSLQKAQKPHHVFCSSAFSSEHQSQLVCVPCLLLPLRLYLGLIVSGTVRCKILVLRSDGTRRAARVFTTACDRTCYSLQLEALPQKYGTLHGNCLCSKLKVRLLGCAVGFTHQRAIQPDTSSKDLLPAVTSSHI